MHFARRNRYWSLLIPVLVFAGILGKVPFAAYVAQNWPGFSPERVRHNAVEFDCATCFLCGRAIDRHTRSSLIPLRQNPPFPVIVTLCLKHHQPTHRQWRVILANYQSSFMTADNSDDKKQVIAALRLKD